MTRWRGGSRRRRPTWRRRRYAATRRGSKAKLGSTRSVAAGTRRSWSSTWPSASVAIDRDLYSRREILQSEIDEQLARVRQDQAGELQKLHRDLAATELVLVDVDRRRAVDEVRRAKRQLDALEVKAPRAGILTWVRDDKGDLPQIGEQVWRGQKLAEIPTLSQLGIEAFVVEADFGGIVAGCEATVTLDAHPELSYQRAR